MGLDINEKVIMVEEIKEALLELSYYSEEEVEASCQYTQENSQQVVISPLAADEDNQDLNFQIHFPSLDEESHQCCKILSHQDRDEKGQENVSSDYSFSKLLFQEKVCQNEIFEPACTQTLDRKPTHDIEFQESGELIYDSPQTKTCEDIEEVVVFFDSLENQGHIFYEKHEEPLFSHNNYELQFEKIDDERKKQFTHISCKGDQIHQIEIRMIFHA